MARTLTDDDFSTWEVYSTGGKYGLTWKPRIVFNCLSDLDRRARFVQFEGDEVEAMDVIERADDAELLRIFRTSTELE